MDNIVSLVLLLALSHASLCYGHYYQHHHHRHGHHQHCSEPSNLHEMVQELNTYHGVHDSLPNMALSDFLNIAEPQPTDQDDSDLSERNLTVFAGSYACNQDFPDDPCPTYYRLNTDHTRFPRHLMEKDCCCNNDGCRDQTTGVPSLRDRRERSCQGLQAMGDRAVCSPTFINVRVLRRTGCRHGVYRYTHAWEPVKVGCSCKVLNVRHRG